uniref:Retroviral envelope protein GP41-like domain-containing protein n=1 Tax=Neovison vison TaxID=452646 RepID=A0A8C7ALD5_NEOVI
MVANPSTVPINKMTLVPLRQQLMCLVPIILLNCYLSQCWNVMAFKLAVTMLIPTHVPIPVSIPEDKLPVVLSRKKRDFGITAAIVTALSISTAAAMAAAVSLAAAIPTAEAVNTLAEGTAAALQTQTQINAHLQAGILIVNQRVDLVQEQVDILGALLGLGCIAPFPAICVTPIAYTNMNDLCSSSPNNGLAQLVFLSSFLLAFCFYSEKFANGEHSSESRAEL